MADIEKAIKNITSERIAIGILLNHPEWVLELNGSIKTDYFFIKAHKMIFHLIVTLLQENANTIDSLAILARAEKIAKATELLAENGGLEYLESLKELAEDYTMEDLELHAEAVTTCSFKRDQEKNLEDLKGLLHSNPDMTISEFDELAEERFQQLMNKYSTSSGMGSIGDVFDEVWHEIEENRQSDGVVGLGSKVPMVNRYFTYENGELIIIGARPKFGKSNFSINEAHHLAVEQGVPVAIFDTEMKTRTFMSRILALDSGVSINEIKSGTYEHDVDKSLAVAISKERIKKAPLWHLFDPYWDRSKVAHKAKLLKLRHNLGLLIYDYIKIAEVSAQVKEHNELGNWTIALKNLAGELDIPILTFAQLSPHERRLADSDKINRYASTIAYLLPKSLDEIRRDHGADEGGTAMLYIDYNRNGDNHQDDDTKGINLIYERHLAKFEQAPYQILDDEYA